MLQEKKQKYKSYILVLLGYQLDLIHQILLEYPNKQNKGINKQRDAEAINNILILLFTVVGYQQSHTQGAANNTNN